LRTTKDQSHGKGGFVFVGNELVLDFLNTRPVEKGETLELIAGFDALLRWFQAAGVLNAQECKNLQDRWGKTAEAQKTTASMRELREGLRKEILAWEHGHAIGRSIIVELNRLMAEHPMRTRLTSDGGVYSTKSFFEVHEPEDLFAPLACSAVRLFTEVDHQRVRKCDQCVLQFHDTSKKGARRWCSMQLCGNRMKVAAYAARQRMSAHN